MTTDELVRALGGRGRHPRWRARCPCHKSRSLTLSIYADADQPRVFCFAGCTTDDILAAVGLTWKDLAPRKEWLTPKAYREKMAQRQAEEKHEAEMKVSVRVWTDQTRRWEAIAALLFWKLLSGLDVAALWHLALGRARERREWLWEAERQLTPSASRHRLPEAQCYALKRTPKWLTAEFVGPEIAAVLL